MAYLMAVSLRIIATLPQAGMRAMIRHVFERAVLSLDTGNLYIIMRQSLHLIASTTTILTTVQR